jgi:hypothetical protein
LLSDGTLSVTFTVPVDPARREVAPHEALTVGGTTLILERVVVTRTEARVYLRRGASGHILENAAVTLTIGKHRYGGRVIDGCPSGQYSGFEHPASAGAGMATG